MGTIRQFKRVTFTSRGWSAAVTEYLSARFIHRQSRYDPGPDRVDRMGTIEKRKKGAFGNLQASLFFLFTSVDRSVFFQQEEWEYYREP